MHIGFSGTRTGLTDRQFVVVERTLEYFYAPDYNVFHHGDCIGADAQAHVIAKKLGYDIVIHPPINPNQRAYMGDAADVKTPKEYLQRNKEIVLDSVLMVLAPGQMNELPKGSGTWQTFRYCTSIGKNYILIYPNGEVQLRIAIP